MYSSIVYSPTVQTHTHTHTHTHTRTEGVVRPGLEPVNGTAVDEGGELPHTAPECIPDGREGQNDVEVLATAIHKVVEEGERRMLSILVLSLGQRSHRLRLHHYDVIQ